jgi:hypothetical protein
VPDGSPLAELQPHVAPLMAPVQLPAWQSARVQAFPVVESTASSSQSPLEQMSPEQPEQSAAVVQVPSAAPVHDAVVPGQQFPWESQVPISKRAQISAHDEPSGTPLAQAAPASGLDVETHVQLLGSQVEPEQATPLQS